MIFHRRPQAMWFIPLAKFPRRQEEQIRNCAPEAIQRYLFWSVTKNYKMIPDVPNILTVGQKASKVSDPSLCKHIVYVFYIIFCVLTFTSLYK
jgi:hypothetical protein